MRAQHFIRDMKLIAFVKLGQIGKVMRVPEKCCLCKSPLNRKEKNVVIKGKAKSLEVCPICQDDIYVNRTRFTEDIMIVPIKKPSLDMACAQKLYICPKEYVAKNPKMIAFYVGGEVGAITHIGHVKLIERNVQRKEILPTSGKKARVPKWKRFEQYSVFHLGDVIELERHIARRGDARGAVIQRRIYVAFHRFLNAKAIEDFYKKE